MRADATEREKRQYTSWRENREGGRGTRWNIDVGGRSKREDIPDVAQCCRDVIILRRRPYHRRDVSDEKAP